LVDQLIRGHRRAGDEVAVVAVDPTSPFSGGAVLGDRIRMHEHALDPGVYIRSMGTRGNQGGLAAATGDVIRLLKAYGFPRILIETVGVGQTEIEIMEHADTTIVVLVPESGDSVQTMKAGVLESADIFVVNKADRPGAGQLASELRGLSHFRRHGVHKADQLDWEIPVLETEAANGKGVNALVEHIGRHRNLLEASGALAQRRMARRRAEFKKRLLAEFHQQLDAVLVSNTFDALVERIDNGGLEPEAAMTALREQLRSRL
jgi:LAO/AO transport system kinase